MDFICFDTDDQTTKKAYEAFEENFTELEKTKIGFDATDEAGNSNLTFSCLSFNLISFCYLLRPFSTVFHVVTNLDLNLKRLNCSTI